jgi:membrane protease YdiL (CAAX protease family)
LQRGKNLFRAILLLLIFLLQVFFTLSPQPFWIHLSVLSIYLLTASLAWIRFGENSSIIGRLNLSAQGLVLLSYSILFGILFFYSQNNFPQASLIAGGSIVLPVLEELFFRVTLLGSVFSGKPTFRSLNQSERLPFFKRAITPIVLTSVAFALCHGDVVSALLGVSSPSPGILAIILIRAVFGWAVADLYLYNPGLALPASFHIAFNVIIVFIAS